MFLPQRLAVRFKGVIFVVACIFIFLILYLYHLQITQSQLFTRLSQNNFLRKEETASPRGNITDCTGLPLATNRAIYNLYWRGTGSRTFDADQQKLLNQIDTLIELSADTKEQIKKTDRLGTKILISKDIPLSTITPIMEQFPQSLVLSVEKQYIRDYPQKELACHIVGYLGLDNDYQGKMGLERVCDKALQGQAGKLIKIINSVGQHLEQHHVQHGLAGKTISTTLNMKLQQAAEELFPADFDGCCILMDSTGALEVMLSRPGFDPCIFTGPLSNSQWKAIQSGNRFINRTVSACYPPASLFKLVTLAASLETGLISPAMHWHCIGHTSFKNRLYHCNNTGGHGILSTEQALAQSCNIPFFEIGKKIKIDTLADYAWRFGLGTKTGLILPEKSGLIPTSHWKKKVKNEPWWPGETLSATIGQSALLTTPIQICVMMNALATGYKVQPRLLTSQNVVKSPLDLRPETLQFLQRCLRSVIRQGTGSRLNDLKDFKIGGKSGTAQLQAMEKKILSKKQLHHGYFAAHFQYKNQSPRTLVIYLENAGSASVAVRMARNFLQRYAAIYSASAP